jgi:hypothetical protein
LGIINVGFDITDQLPIRFLHSSDTGEKIGVLSDSTLLFVGLKRAYDSAKRKVLYSILIEFGIPMKLARLIKMCLNKTFSKHLSDIFRIQNGIK